MRHAYFPAAEQRLISLFNTLQLPLPPQVSLQSAFSPLGATKSHTLFFKAPSILKCNISGSRVFISFHDSIQLYLHGVCSNHCLEVLYKQQWQEKLPFYRKEPEAAPGSLRGGGVPSAGQMGRKREIGQGRKCTCIQLHPTCVHTAICCSNL